MSHPNPSDPPKSGSIKPSSSAPTADNWKTGASAHTQTTRPASTPPQYESEQAYRACVAPFPRTVKPISSPLSSEHCARAILLPKLRAVALGSRQVVKSLPKYACRNWYRPRCEWLHNMLLR
ncbi:hypothetical protein chiPu_0001038 [Chiloscyllium punctatum]|uniref:Uncharacterized protein n=1 Tax=Chiloscyllium punctatum TaxID=137246 RepID=A0A401RWW6_CHIPU|nr:hypothetical protein [Chiloscyllium punctatum]